jgi:hypothetical protein
MHWKQARGRMQFYLFACWMLQGGSGGWVRSPKLAQAVNPRVPNSYLLPEPLYAHRLVFAGCGGGGGGVHRRGAAWRTLPAQQRRQGHRDYCALWL